jgi:hypothetical protein
VVHVLARVYGTVYIGTYHFYAVINLAGAEARWWNIALTHFLCERTQPCCIIIYRNFVACTVRRDSNPRRLRNLLSKLRCKCKPGGYKKMSILADQ